MSETSTLKITVLSYGKGVYKVPSTGELFNEEAFQRWKRRQDLNARIVILELWQEYLT